MATFGTIDVTFTELVRKGVVFLRVVCGLVHWMDIPSLGGRAVVYQVEVEVVIDLLSRLTTYARLPYSFMSIGSVRRPGLYAGSVRRQEGLYAGSVRRQEGLYAGSVRRQEGLYAGSVRRQEGLYAGSVRRQEGLYAGSVRRQEGLYAGSVRRQEGLYVVLFGSPPLPLQHGCTNGG